MHDDKPVSGRQAPKILLGTPAHGDVVTIPYHTSVIRLLNVAKTWPASIYLNVVRSSVISQARNAIASKVLANASITHLLFVDSDMGFEPDLIRKMLEFNRPVVGCVYPKRVSDYRRLFDVSRSSNDPLAAQYLAQSYVGGEEDLVGWEQGKLELRNGFARAFRTGTGIMLIKREVLEQMRQHYPDLWVWDTEGAYRGLGVEGHVLQCFEPLQSPSGLFYSEDYAFCSRWVDGCGGEIWSCISETIIHSGSERFTGNYSAKLQHSHSGSAITE